MKKQIRQFSKYAGWFMTTVLISGLFCTTPALAQTTPSQTPCTQETAYQTVGSWSKQGQDFLANADPSFPKERYKPVLAKAQKALELLKQANPQPIGIQANAYRSIDNHSYTANGSLKFSVTGMYFDFLCELDTPGDPARGQILPSGETGTVVEVGFNSFGRMLNVDERSLGKEMTVNGQIMFFFPKQTGELKGLTILRPGMSNLPHRDEAVIITAGSRSPLKPVTREQYLRAREKFLRTQIKNKQETLQQLVVANEKTFAKVDGNSLLNAQQKAEIKASTVKHTKQMQDAAPQQIKILEGDVAKIESAISRLSPAERQMQAVIGDDWTSLERFFVPESERNSIRLVTIDKSFFDPELPRETIQFITVYWTWNEKAAPAAELIRQFKQNFDFEALKQMLGK